MNADLTNGAALGLALALAAAGTLAQPGLASKGTARILTTPELPTAATEVPDARGEAVPVAHYARIVSLHAVADHLVPELVEPERLVGITSSTRDHHPEGWRFTQRVTIDHPHSVEAILALRPDLVILSNFVDEALVSRLREQDIAIFDLGDMRGITSTVEDIRVLGALLDQRERAARLEDRYRRELAALERAVPDEAMPEGIYLSVYGDAFFGGTTGTSYADLLRIAGVADLAGAKGYREWPQYTTEQLLQLDPALIITQEGMGAAICGHAVLQRLEACSPSGRIVELPGRYHTDPGLGVVPAAQSIQELVHPQAEALLLLSTPANRKPQ